MAIDTTDSYQEFTADGQTAYFAFDFNYVDASEIVVGKRTGDNAYETVAPEYYQVIQNAAVNGGQVRFISNPSGSEIVDNPVPAGTIVRIERRSPETSNATWQIGLEMTEMIALFDTLFRLVQENTGRFDNTIETFATQHGVKLYELLAKHTDKLFYWDDEKKTITPTDFPRQDVVRSVGGLFFRVKVDESTNTPYLEWSKNGIDDWHGMNFGAVENTANDAKEKAERAVATSETALETANSASEVATGAANTVKTFEDSLKQEKSDRVQADETLQLNIDKEQESRISGDTNLQTQIDAMAAASDVADVVGTYADLQAYDTSRLTDNAIIKVLNDETQGGASTYYRWTIGA